MSIFGKTGTSSALNKARTNNGYDNPNKFSYEKRDFAEGEAIVFRILSLEESCAPVVNCVRAAMQFNDGKLYEGQLVADPGAPDNAKIIDDAGSTLAECSPADKMYIPVFALWKLNKNAEVIEEFDKVMFIEAKPSIIKQLKELSTDVKNDCDFEDVPHYHLQIEITSNKQNPYKLYPLKAARHNGNKLDSDDLGRGVPLPEYLGLTNEDLDALKSDFDAIVAEINKIARDERSVASVKKKFARYKEDNDSKKSAPRTSLGRRDKDEDDDAGVLPEEIDGVEESTSEGKTFKTGSNRFKKG